MNKRIIILEPNTANKIAAGEVVERPASIVKELVENALDAGSSAVTVEIRNGGIDYIRITDNGSGIPSDDVRTAFLRHATSKLSSAEELTHIETFGFRGEALASVAAVSKVSMRTRTEDDESGTYIAIEGGVETCFEPCGCPTGTTIEVNELFFNVPARLKFLKSPRSEAAFIGDYVVRLILANTDTAIKFINNGKTVYHSTGDGSLENALFCVYGNAISNSLYPVEFDNGYIRVGGYVGSESIAGKNRAKQSIFVNRRYIKSSLISNAAQRAFDTRLMNGRFPFFVLDITISSREIDVNVHPNKLSVRFRDDERVALSVTRAIAEAMNSVSTAYPFFECSAEQEPCTVRDSDSDADSASAHIISTAGQSNAGTGRYDNIDDYAESTKKVQSNESALVRAEAVSEEFSTVSGDSCGVETAAENIDWSLNKPSKWMLRDSGAAAIPDFMPDTHFERNLGSIPFYSSNAVPTQKLEKPEQIRLDADSCNIIGTVFNTYIIVQQNDAVYYIDQHAAHERLLYEKLVAGELRFCSQLLVMPDYVKLDPVAYSCLEDNLERIEELGFSVELCGELTIRIYAVPDILNFNIVNGRTQNGRGIESFLNEAIAIIEENGSVDETELVRSKLIKASCKHAVKGGDMLDEQQVKALVQSYCGGNVPLTCPHGRPVIISVKKSDLEKQFKRVL